MNRNPTLPDLDLLSLKSAFLVGIKGVGMTALAVLLQDAGLAVSGADVEENFVTDELLSKRSISFQPFSSGIPEGVDVVIYSAAHQGSKGSLVQKAKSQGIPCVSFAQALGLLSRQKKTVVVAGVGGKSTTSAFLSWIFSLAGKKPSFSVGVGNIPNLGISSQWSTESDLFIVEGDEYVADPTSDLTPKFLYLQPHDVICTSLSFDHPDVYPSFEETKQVFGDLFSKIPKDGKLILNGDDEGLVALADGKNPILVGENPVCQYRLEDFLVENGIGKVTLHTPIGELHLECSVPGFHNLRDAAYAATFACESGIEASIIEKAVAEFQSTKRRFEKVGVTKNGVVCFDDYAHHPREIAAIVEALKEWFPREQVTVAFQPHTFSRTKALFTDFIDALDMVPGKVLLLPIFASAREANDPSTKSEQLLEVLQERGKSVEFMNNTDELSQRIQNQVSGVFVTLGAGDIYTAYDHVQF